MRNLVKLGGDESEGVSVRHLPSSSDGPRVGALLGLGRMLFGVLGWYMLVTISLSFVFAGGLYVLWKIPVRIDVEDSSGVSHKVFGWRE